MWDVLANCELYSNCSTHLNTKLCNVNVHRFIYFFLQPATVVLHGQAMNGLRRSFLCRVKMGGMSQEAEYQVQTSTYSQVNIHTYTLIHAHILVNSDAHQHRCVYAHEHKHTHIQLQ